jgi:hypothetical protein
MAFKKSLKNGKVPATMDIEGEDGDKVNLPRRPRGHKATTSDMKRDVAALALRETFKGWMADKEEAISVRERRRNARRNRQLAINSLTSRRK